MEGSVVKKIVWESRVWRESHHLGGEKGCGEKTLKVRPRAQERVF